MLRSSTCLEHFIGNLLKSRRRLEVENLFLRHQLNIILRRPTQRLRLRGSDRALMVWMTRLWPSLLALARVVQPATILRWHRAGFSTYWRWKSQGRPGRPRIEHELRDLVHRMSKENPLWGAPRDPWRAVEARIRSRGVNGFEVHDLAPWTAIAELADIPAQSRGGHCGD
jgi:hypothetical protein